MKRKKRTEIDFSKHKLIVTEQKGMITHWLKVPDTIIHNVKFTNIHGEGLLVTGDFYNWFFSRQFIPTEKSEYTSSGYWIEKLEMYSSQSGYKFDSDKLESELQELVQYGIDNDYNEEKMNQLIEFVENAEIDNEYVWIAYCQNKTPNWLDYEKIPNGKVIHPYLLAIFDAYDEIIDRLKAK